MRLCFLLARRVPDEPSEIVAAAAARLRRRGFEVGELIAEEALRRVDDLAGQADLWLLKSYTPLSLSVAAALHAAGARLLNPFPASLAARDKIAAAGVLARAAIPAPRTWVTGDLALLRPLLAETPLVVKPAMGWRGQGVATVHTEAELAALPPPREPLLAQEWLPGPGQDLRVYVAGERIFATRKPFSSTSYSLPGEPVAVAPEVRDIAQRCGRAFGLTLFGLDLIETPQGPRVVDVNIFPGYKGIPEAPEAVADAIADCAEGRFPLPDASPPPRRPEPARAGADP